MTSVKLVAAERDQQEELLAAAVSNQEVQELARGVAAPVEVLYRQHDRRALRSRGQAAQKREESFVELRPRPFRPQFGSCFRAMHRQKTQLRGDAYNRLVGTVLAPANERPDRFHDRREWERSLGQAHASALEHHRAACQRLVQRHREGAVFADAGLAPDEHGPPFAAPRLLERLRDRPEFGLAPNQLGTDDSPAHGAIIEDHLP